MLGTRKYFRCTMQAEGQMFICRLNLQKEL